MIDYEILLMLDPDLPEERQEEIVKRTRDLVEKSGIADAPFDFEARLERVLPHLVLMKAMRCYEHDLQAIAESFNGVERSFAVQAGREVRILVRPEEIDDLTATRLARDIVKKIEEQLTYPGQIKVTVIRETRAVEYAK